MAEGAEGRFALGIRAFERSTSNKVEIHLFAPWAAFRAELFDRAPCCIRHALMRPFSFPIFSHTLKITLESIQP
eukprot:scaffold86203_cov34-Tisochrysis_lutea.AAC.1